MKESNPRENKHILAAQLLKKHRLRIDALDRRIMKLIGDRFGVIRAVAQIKIRHDLPPVIDDRVIEVRDNALALARKHGVDTGFTHALYNMMIYRSCELEAEIKQKSRRQKTPRARAKKTGRKK